MTTQTGSRWSIQLTFVREIKLRGLFGFYSSSLI
jgi:hypothetical protein